MLLSILGSPCSGKTTTAVTVFAQLKEQGILAEFIPEQARTYIARKRLTLGLSPRDFVPLDDQDQIKIMDQQMELEALMKKACNPETIIICDSCSLNALFYMSDVCLQDSKKKIVDALNLYDGVYYACPLTTFIEGDSNRVHTAEFSRKFHDRVPGMLETSLRDLKISLELDGIASARSFAMSHDVLMRILQS